MFSHQILQKPKNLQIDEQIIQQIFTNINSIVQKPQQGTINIVFVDDETMQTLNRDYRNIDKVTDVLSFHYFTDFSETRDIETAGEVILSINKIISQGVEYGLGTTGEFYKLVIHSVLHILGYDHELDSDYEIMQPIETEVWNKTFDK